jgi:hypothetical protein
MHTGGALDVVVEGADLVAIVREDRDGVEVREILPFDAAFGVALLRRRDEFVDKSQVLLAPHAVLPQAEIQRVLEQDLIVRADIENDGQTALRRHAGAGGIERELADRDTHAAGAEIAEAEDTFAVGDAMKRTSFSGQLESSSFSRPRALIGSYMPRA